MSYANNPKAHFDYEILETLEAGLILTGSEVKAIRAGKVSIQGSYVKILAGEIYLVGALVQPYQSNNVPESYDPQRTRKLLLKKKELRYLVEKSQEAGLTLVPLKLYDNYGLIKLEFGLARGKKKYDKRETIKKRDVERDIRRKVKS